MIENVVVGLKDPVRKPIVAHELPDVLDGIEFGAFGRQRDEGDVGRHDELVGEVPSGLVDKQRGVSPRRDRIRDLGQVEVHGVAVAVWQHQGGALAVLGADSTENIGRCRALVVSGDRPRSAQGPATGEFILLTYSGLVRKPDLDLVPTYALLAGDLVQRGRPFFLKSSIAPTA
jgi:hypothetical protein